MKAFRYVLTLFRLEPRLLLRFAATSLGRSATSLAAILLLRDFLSRIVADVGTTPAFVSWMGPQQSLWAVAGLLWLTFMAGTLMSLDNQVTQQRMVKVLELGMIERVVRHLLGMSVSFFERQSHGDILQAVRHDVSALRSVIFGLARVVLEGVTALGLFAAAFWLSPRLTFWALIVLPIAVVPVLMLARRAFAHSRTIRQTGYVLLDAILQMLGGIRLIKVFQAEQTELSSTLDTSRRYFDEKVAMVRVQAFAQSLLESLANTGMVVVVVVGGLEVIGGRLDWPTLLAFVFAARALQGPLNAINGSLISLATHGASAERVAEFLQTEPDIADPVDPESMPTSPHVVAARGIHFQYIGTDRPVLHDVSFTMRAGETLGIVGPSGAGKSTLLGLVARFFDPSAGAITLDGVDLRRFRRADLYERMAIVSQSPFLFATTIRENIRCGFPSASDADVERAATVVGLHDEIMAMEAGYETRVGLGGTPLSGGQGQRVNIARALLKNPAILLLDEATSSLDSIAELKVQDALERLMAGRTTLVIAHRLSTLRKANRILVLDGGYVVGYAPHADLLDSCAVYKRMWELQQLPDASGDGPRIAGVQADNHLHPEL